MCAIILVENLYVYHQAVSSYGAYCEACASGYSTLQVPSLTPRENYKSHYLPSDSYFKHWLCLPGQQWKAMGVSPVTKTPFAGCHTENDQRR